VNVIVTFLSPSIISSGHIVLSGRPSVVRRSVVDLSRVHFIVVQLHRPHRSHYW